MPKFRTEAEVAAGKLISAIQKVWDGQMGEDSAAESEAVMHTSHELLQAASSGGVAELLQGRSIRDFLGQSWVQSHPEILPHLNRLQSLIESSSAK